ncbi:MAG: hypothetical protein IJI14_02100 [Anaerolineaceae bacterium]|nr:hypothetical protein [Anaerolineaceae bacterium]
MKQTKLLLIVLIMLASLVLTVTAFADQDGNKRWCWIDENGCWITGDNDEHWYIHFWTESARKYFMGDSTAPYTNVVDFPENLRRSGIMDLEPAPASHASPNAVILTPVIIDGEEGRSKKLETLIDLFIKANPETDADYIRQYVQDAFGTSPDSAIDEQIRFLKDYLNK